MKLSAVTLLLMSGHSAPTDGNEKCIPSYGRCLPARVPQCCGIPPSHTRERLLSFQSIPKLQPANSTSMLTDGLLLLRWSFAFLHSPILIHLVLYRSASAEGHNDFLLLGPSGSGKTAFCALVGSNAYRSVNDPTLADHRKTQVKYRVRDTPGHGKLRDAQGISQLKSMADSKPTKGTARGVIFMVDAGTIMDETELRDAAGYLHDVLLILQRRLANSRNSVFRKLPDVPVMIAANKQDLFTALPANSVKQRLEAEIERIRQSRRKGVLDADVNAGDDEQEILGSDEGQEKFTFKLLEEEVGLSLPANLGDIGDGRSDRSPGLRGQICTRFPPQARVCLLKVRHPYPNI
ncbi:predicted protein [Uncinocarpus reesii 1704]|uniref:Signal recognition particle receptor subunit beta n=1 Tax=Uncinocarpus reesii (strain UAMH 1704) TaxID=336963 RepID=C4JF02_UNCRE|nr:uncharacterized protein UREG_00903 [Uncinocarpus reesii 1704]EEP76055.1 predicted protein [Uncinocarpus reesii 1704]